MFKLGLHNPLPSSMRSECKKAADILTSFVDPNQAFGPDKVIPLSILAQAKGLAVLTVSKIAFVGSGRFGSGIVVARLKDGSWSAPSAIMTAGGGIGGQIGIELTDFVFILNDSNAVLAFSQTGAIALGGNVSLAAGPLGRNAEAAGAASLKGVAAIFSYSKTKGLFAGVSLEGSFLKERADANEKMYHSRVKASELLSGAIPPAAAAEPLMRVLASPIFASSSRSGHTRRSMYHDVPVYADDNEDVTWDGKRARGYGDEVGRDRTGPWKGSGDFPSRGERASTWADEGLERSSSNPRLSRASTFANGSRAPTTSGFDDDYVYSDSKPSRPSAPKPALPRNVQASELRPDQALALFNFSVERAGDLGFRKGDVITIERRTGSQDDWWEGRVGDRQGLFPSNYVRVGTNGT
ncbi:MAG: hypothetical protein M1826_006199 [Phylliscum demangeonii]|nr:MAG: hypothetical protein M1826_006199 [Phylliscum demangeonii]